MQRLRTILAWCDKRFPQTGVLWLEVMALVAVVAASLIVAWKLVRAEPTDFTELVKAIAWPGAVCLGLLAFRDPLGQFLSGLSQRIHKISAFSMELELTAVTAKEATTQVPSDLKRGQAIYVADSSGGIFAQLQAEGRADFVVIDIGDGEEWLTSRLFLVAALFERTRGVRCMVFVDGKGGANRFSGLASPETVRWRLAYLYPWLEIALAKAVTSAVPNEPGQVPSNVQMIRTKEGAFEPLIAGMIANAFINSLKLTTQPKTESDTWVKIHDQPDVWERAGWVTSSILRQLIDTSRTGSAVDIGNRKKDDLVRAALGCAGEFVAGIADGKFEELFDRQALLEELAGRTLSDGSGAGSMSPSTSN